MNQTQNKVNWPTAVKLGGAFMATCIGSGFATGSEFLQFFCCYGILGALGAILVSFIVYFLFTKALFNIGQVLPNDKQTSVLSYYFGDKIGKILDWYCAIFVGGCYFIMLSGAGTTLNEYLGWDIMAGSVLMAVISVITVILGLKRLTDIIGVIGPVIAVFTVIIGLYALIKGAPNLALADALVPSMGFMKAGANWLIAGVLYPCFAMLTLTPVLPSMGASAGNKKTTTAAATFGAIFFHVALGLVVFGILANLKLVGNAQVPNLALAGLLGSVASGIFVVMIILAIYSTACPMMWGFCAKIFKDEKSTKYKIGVLALTVVGMVVCYFFPLATLINFMFSISGYIGAVVSVGMIISTIIKRKQRQNNETENNERTY